MTRLEIALTVAALATAVLSATTVSAELYRWVDATGKVNIVSDLYMVPAEYREAAIQEAAHRSGGSLNVVHQEGTESAAPTTSGHTPAAMGEANVSGGHDESWWRNRSMELHRRVDDLNRDLEQAQADEDDYTGEAISPTRSGRARGQGHGSHRRRAGRAAAAGDDDYYGDGDDEPSVADLQRAVSDAERDLEQFEQQARRAGVPPGWLR